MEDDTLRQVAGSLLLAAFSAALVIGGISLALAESYVPETPTPTETQAQTSILNTPASQSLEFFTETLPAPSEFASPPTSCPPPVDWIPVTVQPGEDLVTLSLRHQSTPEELTQANCLFSNDLPAGSILYVPPQPAKTDVPCGPPPGWISYIVRAGNTMYSISHAYSISISELQFANCIPSYQYSISVGQSLRVPNVVITRTPLVTATPSLTPVSIIFPTLTHTPTRTQTATITSTSTATATDPPPTATPTATATIISFPPPIP